VVAAALEVAVIDGAFVAVLRGSGEELGWLRRQCDGEEGRGEAEERGEWNGVLKSSRGVLLL
jgi:hypothetical protein